MEPQLYVSGKRKCSQNGETYSAFPSVVATDCQLLQTTPTLDVISIPRWLHCL